MAEAVYEFFERINKLEPAQIVEELKKAKPELIKLMYIVLKQPKCRLPEGLPPYRPNLDFARTHSIFWHQFNGLDIYFEGGRGQDLPQREIETRFIRLLELVHPNDALLLVEVKDGDWKYSNVTSEVISEAYNF